MGKNKKCEEIVYKIIDNRLCDIQLMSSREDVFDYCEEVRELLVKFVEGNLDKSFCDKCGCNEFYLCYHILIFSDFIWIVKLLTNPDNLCCFLA